MTEDVVMANECVLDVAEGLGAFADDVIDLVEEASLDTGCISSNRATQS